LHSKSFKKYPVLQVSHSAVLLHDLQTSGQALHFLEIGSPYQPYGQMSIQIGGEEVSSKKKLSLH